LIVFEVDGGSRGFL